MTRNMFLSDFAAMRAETLSVDAEIKRVAHAFRTRAMTAVQAITKLRAIGVCEPEIRETIGAGLAGHL